MWPNSRAVNPALKFIDFSGSREGIPKACAQSMLFGMIYFYSL